MPWVLKSKNENEWIKLVIPSTLWRGPFRVSHRVSSNPHYRYLAWLTKPTIPCPLSTASPQLNGGFYFPYPFPPYSIPSHDPIIILVHAIKAGGKYYVFFFGNNLYHIMLHINLLILSLSPPPSFTSPSKHRKEKSKVYPARKSCACNASIASIQIESLLSPTCKHSRTRYLRFSPCNQRIKHFNLGLPPRPLHPAPSQLNSNSKREETSPIHRCIKLEV